MTLLPNPHTAGEESERKEWRWGVGREGDKQTETHSQASRTERFLGVVSKQNIDKEISRNRQSSIETLQKENPYPEK